jgi:MoaA/NifB/PqqE/SkfB family radical SAM enzyme
MKNLFPELSHEGLSIEITRRCNSKCIHCFATNSLKNNNELSFETIKEIMDEGNEIGYKHLHITGGEPLLHKKFFDIIDYSLNIGYKSIFVNTNGLLLSENICEKIASYKESISISVSIQGFQELHDSVRGKNSFDEAITGIKNALSKNIETTIFTTVGKTLLKEIPKFSEFIFTELEGVEGLKLIQLINFDENSFSMGEELLSPEDFISLIKSSVLLNLYGHKISILEDPLATVVAGLLKMEWIPHSPHLNRMGRIVILADKNMVLSHSDKNSFGKYKPGILPEILSSKKYKNAVAEDDIICPSCKHNNICKKFKMFKPTEDNRDLNHKTPYCVRVIDATLSV